jgi:hypothetical protein
VSRATAEDDIAFAEAVLRKVRSASQEFAVGTADTTCRFELIYDDGGSSFLLAWREGDHLTMSARYGGKAG